MTFEAGKVIAEVCRRFETENCTSFKVDISHLALCEISIVITAIRRYNTMFFFDGETIVTERKIDGKEETETITSFRITTLTMTRMKLVMPEPRPTEPIFDMTENACNIIGAIKERIEKGEVDFTVDSSHLSVAECNIVKRNVEQTSCVKVIIRINEIRVIVAHNDILLGCCHK
ncbi:MAG: hypothetical protein ACRC5M_05160 [Anaeroplasmataceae bacterium]